MAIRLTKPVLLNPAKYVWAQYKDDDYRLVVLVSDGYMDVIGYAERREAGPTGEIDYQAQIWRHKDPKNGNDGTWEDIGITTEGFAAAFQMVEVMEQVYPATKIQWKTVEDFCAEHEITQEQLPCVK